MKSFRDKLSELSDDRRVAIEEGGIELLQDMHNAQTLLGESSNVLLANVQTGVIVLNDDQLTRMS